MKRHLILTFTLLSLTIIFIVVFLFQLVFLPVEFFSDREVIFRVEKGKGSKEIALDLEKEGLIRWAPAFRIYVLLKGTAAKIKAGEYFLSPSMGIPQIAEKFFRGDAIEEKITIIEGWDLKDIGYYFEDRGIAQKEEFWQAAAKDFSSEFYFLKDKPENSGLEGYLFPDTYEIIKGESLDDIIKRILNNFDRKLGPDLRKEIEEQGKSIFEIIIMASLIEKEVRTFEDKELVSGIFWKRLQTQKPLESCATIAYILGVNKWRYSFEDTRTSSPYNTYLNLGLPPGPISNPGLESIRAAIYPKNSQYWYFLSTPEGETIFSETLEKHNFAKAKYLK